MTIRLPSIDTSQRGMEARKPTSSMALTISVGRVAAVDTAPPMPDMTLETTPPQMWKIASMISRE